LQPIDSGDHIRMPSRRHLKESLQGAVEDVQGGLISVGGDCGDCIPLACGLEVEGVGHVALPVCQEQAEKIKVVCALAPFGRGDETLHDARVRHTWQLEPSKLTIQNPEFQKGVTKLTYRVAEALGCLAFDVTAMPYKMLLYEPGSHFEEHRDTEKEPGMFGTLIVQLPSIFEGGGLVVKHPDESEFVHHFGQDKGKSAFSAFYAAHFADVKHAFQPLTSGFRLALVYSLCWSERSKIEAMEIDEDAMGDNRKSSKLAESWPASFAPSRLRVPEPKQVPASKVDEKIVQAFCHVFEEWKKAPNKLLAAAILLDHMYTPDGLNGRGWAALKGWDASLARVLHEVRTPLRAYLVCLEYHMRQSGDSIYRTFEPSLWIDPQNNCADFYRTLFRDPRKERIAKINIRRKEELFLTEDDFEFNCGNEASSISKKYHRHAIVLWPAENSRVVSQSLPRASFLGFLVESKLLKEASELASAKAKRELISASTDSVQETDHSLEFLLEKEGHVYNYSSDEEERLMRERAGVEEDGNDGAEDGARFHENPEEVVKLVLDMVEGNGKLKLSLELVKVILRMLKESQDVEVVGARPKVIRWILNKTEIYEVMTAVSDFEKAAEWLCGTSGNKDGDFLAEPDVKLLMVALQTCLGKKKALMWESCASILHRTPLTSTETKKGISEMVPSIFGARRFSNPKPWKKADLQDRAVWTAVVLAIAERFPLEEALSILWVERVTQIASNLLTVMENESLNNLRARFLQLLLEKGRFNCEFRILEEYKFLLSRMSEAQLQSDKVAPRGLVSLIEEALRHCKKFVPVEEFGFMKPLMLENPKVFEEAFWGTIRRSIFSDADYFFRVAAVLASLGNGALASRAIQVDVEMCSRVDETDKANLPSVGTLKDFLKHCQEHNPETFSNNIRARITSQTMWNKFSVEAKSVVEGLEGPIVDVLKKDVIGRDSWTLLQSSQLSLDKGDRESAIQDLRAACLSMTKVQEARALANGLALAADLDDMETTNLLLEMTESIGDEYFLAQCGETFESDPPEKTSTSAERIIECLKPWLKEQNVNANPSADAGSSNP